MSGMEEEKVYIFVSHSHRDIDKVRLVRNYLEEKGAEPILFFLKSVTDDNEVADLIKREIDARLWFLYCRSRNAENSNWVRTELDYVKKTGKKNFFEIDLDRDLSFAAKEGGAGAAALTEKVARRLDACIDDLKTLRRVFVSYSHYDAAVAEKLADGSNLRADELTASHADWAEAFAKNYTITKDNAMEIVQKETGLVFAKVLEHAGVYKRTPEGKGAFLRFIEQI